MNWKAQVIWFSLFVVAQGCSLSQNVPITDADRLLAKNASNIKIIHYYSLPMTMTTTGDALVSSGKARYVGEDSAGYTEGGNYWGRLERAYRFPDPMIIMKSRFIKGLKKEGFRNILDIKEPLAPYLVDGYAAPEEMVFNKYRKKYGNGLILEMRMNSYQLHYMPTKWSTYWLGNSVIARLIRLSDGKILWRGFGSVIGYSDEEYRYKMKDIDRKEALRLKKGIRSSSEKCADQLIAHFMGRDKKQ